MVIYIDFQAGAHGNFLEFVCNCHLAGIKSKNPTPFNKNGVAAGASHDKQYTSEIVFKAGHFSWFNPEMTFFDSKIISIDLHPDDMLPMASVSLLRAGEKGLHNNQLEIDTFTKFNNKSYQWVLDNIVKSFFQDQIKNSYNAVKDASWPDVETLEDFNQLPNWIQQECLHQHNLKLLILDQNNPNCPRYVLREFFKLGFKNPTQFGFMALQENLNYDQTNQVIKIPFGSFYSTDAFISQVELIADFTGYKIINLDQLIVLHQQFLENQPYKDAKPHCDSIVQDIIAGKKFVLPELDLLKESYIEACLEKHYNKEIQQNNQWFQHSTDIQAYLK